MVPAGRGLQASLRPLGRPRAKPADMRLLCSSLRFPLGPVADLLALVFEPDVGVQAAVSSAFRVVPVELAPGVFQGGGREKRVAAVRLLLGEGGQVRRVTLGSWGF
jgi:hypothetical protein